jgi:hypothetical protein
MKDGVFKFNSKFNSKENNSGHLNRKNSKDLTSKKMNEDYIIYIKNLEEEIEKKVVISKKFMILKFEN